MKYIKTISAVIFVFAALLGVAACAVLKPIGNIDLVEATAVIPKGDNPIASVSITAIVTGWVEAPAYILMDQDNARTPDALRKPQWVPSIAYIVRHPSRGTVIFDFGLKAGNCAYGLKPFYWVPCRNKGHDNLASYLTANSEVLADIIYLIPSHFHGDHISGLSGVLSLSTAPLLVTDAALDEIKSLKRDFAGIPTNMVVADMSVVSMNANFVSDPLLGRFFDVFGDASLKVFETSGHSPGHISAIVKTDSANIILSFDASHLRANYEMQIPSGAVSNQKKAKESLERLRQIETKLDDVQIIFGHDTGQWTCTKGIIKIGGKAQNEC